MIIILENDTDVLLSRKDTIAATAKYFNLSTMSEFGKLWVENALQNEINYIWKCEKSKNKEGK